MYVVSWRDDDVVREKTMAESLCTNLMHKIEIYFMYVQEYFWLDGFCVLNLL